MSLLMPHNSVAQTGNPRPKPKPETETALDTQVGGNHYKDLAIQPAEFSMTMGYDACAHSILKYVTRHRAKNGKQDLEKALHFVRLRREIMEKQGLEDLFAAIMAIVRVKAISWWAPSWDGPVHPAANIKVYCEANCLNNEETRILLQLDDWVRSGRTQGKAGRYTSELESQLIYCIEYYDELFPSEKL